LTENFGKPHAVNVARVVWGRGVGVTFTSGYLVSQALAPYPT